MSDPVIPRRFTVSEYHRMAEVGIFDEDDHVELPDGRIIEKSEEGGVRAETY